MLFRSTGIGCGASALGPALAGYLLEQFAWGSAFLLTVPIAVVALVLAVLVVPKRLGEDEAPVDHLGGALSVLAIGLLTLGLHFASDPGEGAAGLALVAVSAIVFAAFVTSDVTIIKQLGVGIVFAILVDATIIRGLLVPALMRIAGRANWWAPAWLRRVHRRFGLSDA